MTVEGEFGLGAGAGAFALIGDRSAGRTVHIYNAKGDNRTNELGVPLLNHG